MARCACVLLPPPLIALQVRVVSLFSNSAVCPGCVGEAESETLLVTDRGAAVQVLYQKQMPVRRHESDCRETNWICDLGQSPPSWLFVVERCSPRTLMVVNPMHAYFCTRHVKSRVSQWRPRPRRYRPRAAALVVHFLLLQPVRRRSIQLDWAEGVKCLLRLGSDVGRDELRSGELS